LGAVKSEFLKFGGVFEKVLKRIEDVDSILKNAELRTRAMNRKLRSVEALPEAEAALQLDLEPVNEPAQAADEV
jgi:DNA recombination protein RmuC